MVLLFDIGGTKMRLACSQDGVTFSDPEIIETPKKFEDGMTSFVGLAKKIASDKTITAVSGGVAGPLNSDKTMLSNSPNLPGWIDKPLVQTISNALNAPVYLENDTAMVGLGEAVTGAGRKKNIVAYVTISTGVNGVRIVNKKIDASVFGFEIGHQIINGIDISNDPQQGRLGQYISGKWVEEKYNKKPWEIDDPKTWDEIARWTAYGMINTAVYWSPEVIILGGSMMKTKGIPLDIIKKYYQEYLYIFPEKPKLLKATLGDIGGLHGALAFVKQKQSE